MAERPTRSFGLTFRLGDIPVTVDPTFWLVLLFGFMSYGNDLTRVLLWAAIIFFSVLVHELGHAFACRAFGSASRIELYVLGGLTWPEKELARWQGVLMSLAGPFAGFALGGVAIAVSALYPPQTDLAVWFLRSFWFVNFGWGLVNLAPVPPLDGGHVLQGLLGPSRRKLTHVVGAVIAAAGAALLGYLGYTIAAVLFMSFAFRNVQARAALAQLEKQGGAPQRPAANLLEVMLEGGWRRLMAGDADEAEHLGRAVLAQASEPAMQNRARDLLAWVALTRHNGVAARNWLEQVEPKEAARPLTWAMVLDALGEKGEAAVKAIEAAGRERSDQANTLAARLLVDLGQLDEADRLIATVGWQGEALKADAAANVAYARGDFAKAAEHYERGFTTGSDPRDAYNAACCHARAGDATRSLGWLERALAAGFSDRQQLERDPDLEAVRGSPEFARLLGRLPADSPE